MKILTKLVALYNAGLYKATKSKYVKLIMINNIICTDFSLINKQTGMQSLRA